MTLTSSAYFAQHDVKNNVIDLRDNFPLGAHGAGNRRISCARAAIIRGELTADLSPFVKEDAAADGALVCKLPADVAQGWVDYLAAGAQGISDGSLRGQGLSAFTVVTGVLVRGWYHRRGEYAAIEDGPLKMSAVVIDRLAYAIAVMESCLPASEKALRHR